MNGIQWDLSWHLAQPQSNILLSWTQTQSQSKSLNVQEVIKIVIFPALD